MYIRGCLFDLEHRYAIDENLLGKRMSFSYSDSCKISIVFPTVILKDGYLVLDIPGVMERFGIDEREWGKVNEYNTIDTPKPSDAWISAVLIECCGENIGDLPDSIRIQRMGKRIVKIIQLINPESIRIPSDKQTKILCEVILSAIVEDNHNPHIEEVVNSLDDDRTGRLTISDIKESIRNHEQMISAPYELVYNAQVNVQQLDFRAAILNCATAVEITLKSKIEDYLQSVNAPKKLHEYVISKADGFSNQKKLCKQFEISLEGIPNVGDKVANLRNRIIHGGYEPFYQEANEACKATREMLSVLGVSMFEKRKTV